jgi:hypothetical protein
MRTKLTALLVTAAALAAGAAAQAAPIPVATYTFQSQDDVNAFQKVTGTSCKRKWVGNQALGIGVGNDTSSCAYRSSVVADSSDQFADQGMVATVTVGGGTAKLQKKSFAGVGVRRSDSAGYVLRVLPNAHKWQYFRDPKGAAEPKLVSSGKGKFVKIGSKPNMISIRAFSNGTTTTSVIGSVNGRGVVAATDSATDQPDGRQTVVTSGAKGSGAGTGITGVFDNVLVQVPNPFG